MMRVIPPPPPLPAGRRAARVLRRRRDFSGDAKLPDGYKTFSTAGISFAYPGDWHVAERTDADGAPAVEITPPDKAKTPYGLIQLSVSPAPASASRASPTSAGSSSATSTTPRSTPTSSVEIPGAKQALQRLDGHAAGPRHRPDRGPLEQPRRAARQRRRGRADRRLAAA